MAARKATESKNTQTDRIYQIKVTLRRLEPLVWRRLQVSADITLKHLHDIIQIAMNWDDAHLHSFEIGKTYYGPPGYDLDMENERRFTLRQIAPTGRKKFSYEYDFGDSWNHDILIEKMLSPEEGVVYPRCIAGERACPPDDSGGVWGYQYKLEALADPKHEYHEDVVERFGEDFDPEAFDIDAVNRRLQRLR